MWNLFLQIVSGILGLWLAVKFVPGVDFEGSFFIFPKQLTDFSEFLKTLVFVGALLGFLNFFVKPILKKITLPLRIITFNLFTLVIMMALVWAVDIFSPELIIKGLKPLFFTTIIVWGINLILSKWWPAKPKYQTRPSFSQQ